MHDWLYTYETLAEGQALPPLRSEVTPAFVADYRRAIGEPPDTASTHGAAPSHDAALTDVPPAIVTIFTTNVMGRSGIDRPSGGIHFKHSYRHLAPIALGATIVTTGQVARKFLRDGRKVLVFETACRDEARGPVAECTVTMIYP
jgi:hypothetical protein